MKTVAIIQARMGSTRLPGKVLMMLGDKTALERCIEQVQKSMVKDIVVATVVLKRDLPIVKLCASIGISVYCGSEQDVLDRYYQSAKLFEADHIVRITADCPMLCPQTIDRVVQLHYDTGADYTSNVIVRTFPNGHDVEIMTFAALERSYNLAVDPFEREHMDEYILRNQDKFNCKNLLNDTDESRVRLTLDTQEDYEKLKRFYEKIPVFARIY